jgi:hypothetical protein
MPKAKLPNILRILFLVGFFGLVGIGCVAGLAYAGWRLVSAPSASGADAGDARNTESKDSPGGIVGWLRSADEKMAVISSAREARDQQALENLEGPKRPIVASQPIAADERIYQQYIARNDVLVMVEYYADW